MEAKTCYQLVAWTEGDEIRIRPSVFYLVEEPYLDRIYDTEMRDPADPAEAFELSRAHESYGDFLLRSGMKHEALDAYVEAAKVCLAAAEPLGPRGVPDAPGKRCQPLRSRFYALYDRCCVLVHKQPKLRPRLLASGLVGDYLQLSGKSIFRFAPED